jgi:hypothetical protein
MDFVFMLTRDDATVPDALEMIEAVRPLALRNIGFKDIGAEPETLRLLAAAIREAGASVWMEIVSTTREAELDSVALGRDLGVDFLMGGQAAEDALRVLGDAPTRYLPFAGRPVGHPTRLGGAAHEIEAHCRAFRGLGCAGVDILAYRATEAAPLDLVMACRRGFGDGGLVVAAGSIDCAERVAAVKAAGADAFTIGTAAIDCAYAPGAGPLAAQLGAVLRDCTAL